MLCRHFRGFGLCLGAFLILQGADAVREAVEANETSGVALLIDVVFAERHEAFVVERERARAAGDNDVAFVQLQRDIARDAFLRDVHKCVVRFTFGGPPAAFVHQVGVARGDGVFRGEGAAVERELFELAVGGVEQRAARGFVDTARLHADEAIFDEIDAADAVTATDGVQRVDDADWREALAVDGDWGAGLEGDGDFFWRVRGRFWGVGEHEEVGRWGLGRIFEDAALVGDVPDVAVARVDLFLGRGNRDILFGSVFDGVFAAPDVPLAPWSDHGEIGGERGVGQLEADLVVSFPRAAVRERVGANLAGDFDLAAGDERAAHGGAEEVFAAVDGASAEGGEDEIPHVLLAQVFHVALVGAGGDGLGLDPLELVALADVGGDADHLGAWELVLEPGDDDRCIEAAGVGEGDFRGGDGHGRSL